jgi:hypothetical protein
MPIYEYVVIRPDGSAGERFEILQSVHTPPLTKHPETGEPVERIISQPAAPKVPGGTRKLTPDLSDRNLEKMGFTKYKRTGSGDRKYEKVVGDGPDLVKPD